jgi:hypothetical protein
LTVNASPSKTSCKDALERRALRNGTSSRRTSSEKRRLTIPRAERSGWFSSSPAIVTGSAFQGTSRCSVRLTIDTSSSAMA